VSRPCAKSFHRPAARGQIQSQDLHRHVCLSRRRPDRCLVLSFAHVVWPRPDGYFFCRGATRGATRGAVVRP
jgi:hypothetical protein